MQVSRYCLLLLLAMIAIGSGQEECTNNGGLVGFTALTPDQLIKVINNTIQTSFTEISDLLLDQDQNECTVRLLSLNHTIDELVHRVSALEKVIVGGTIEEVVAESIKKYVSSAVKEALQNFTQSPPTMTPPTTTSTTSFATPAVTTPPLPLSSPSLPSPLTDALPTLPPLTPPSSTQCSLGLSPSLPAASCKQIYVLNNESTSGLYWISNGNNKPQRIYCDMNRTCGGITGGWMRVVYINMTNSSHSCPQKLREIELDSRKPRLCAGSRVGCTSAIFPLFGLSYNMVCGRVLGYQYRTPNGFFPYEENTGLTIDDAYLEGVSITHGANPRKHIWSFAAALDETDAHLSSCPCSNLNLNPKPSVPPFIGNDYFCDTGTTESAQNILYVDNPLWDGQGCGPNSSCCDVEGLPWFAKTLRGSVRDNIELRVCRDDRRHNEEIPLELIEIYVR